jgi:hypothetical protein
MPGKVRSLQVKQGGPQAPEGQRIGRLRVPPVPVPLFELDTRPPRSLHVYNHHRRRTAVDGLQISPVLPLADFESIRRHR